MNSLERVTSRLKGERVDRPPNFNIFMCFAAHHAGFRLRDFYLDHRVLVDANLAILEDFSVDLVQAISDPYREACGFGADIEFPPDGLPVCRKPLLEDPARLSTLRAPDPSIAPRMLDRLKGIRLMREKVGEGAPVMGWVEGGLAEAAVLRGSSNLLLDMVDRPEWVLELIECCTNVEITFARAQVKAGATMIGLGDAIASQISQEMYARFALPFEKRIFDEVHSLGGWTRLHICGDTTRLLPHMATSGADVIDLDWMVDWKAANAAYGEVTALCGNMDPVSVMLQGSPATVYQSTLDCLSTGGVRSFSGAGCEIPDGTPPENLHAQIRAVEWWGEGPSRS